MASNASNKSNESWTASLHPALRFEDPSKTCETEYEYSRRHKNGDVSVPFRSVPSKRNASSAVCRFITSTPPVYFRSVSVPFRMRERGSTPRPCPLPVRSPLPLLSRRHCSSTYQAICRWILLRVVDRSSVAGGCSVELTARETV